MYFKTNSTCYIITGADKSCLYNLMNGKIEEISNQDAAMLMELDSGVPIEEVKHLNKELLDKLRTELMGEFYKDNFYIEKLRYGLPRNIKSFASNRMRIYNLYLQISNECNMDCHFCVPGNTANRKTSCKRFDAYEGKKLERDDYFRVLETGHRMGSRVAHILGGEPVKNKRLLLDLLEHSRKIGYSDVYIYTNALLLDDEVINNTGIGKYVIHVAAHDQATMRAVDGKGNNIEVLLNNIEKLREKNIPFYFSICISDRNYKSMPAMVEYFKGLKPWGFAADYVYEETQDEEYNKLIQNKSPNNICFNSMQFLNNLEHHPCMYGKISVFENGDVTVCPIMRDDTIGNVTQNSLLDIIKSKKQNEYWDLTLNKLHKCSDCGYRFACTDCRAIEKSQTGSLLGKKYCNIC